MTELETLAALNWSLHKRKLARLARSEAGKRGVSTEWKRRGENCRRLFGS